MKKLTTIAAISMALFLSACAPADENPNGRVPTNTEDSTVSVSTESESESTISVQDTQNYEAAVSQKNAALCENIENENLKESCAIEVNTLIQADTDVMEAEALEAESIRLNAIIEGGNLAECDSIEDENWKRNCMTNITINEVIETKNQSLCSRLETETQKQNCLDAYNLAVEAEAAS